MRKSEITPELIELSKKAKELGFPQVVEEGDWVCEEDGYAFLVDCDIAKRINEQMSGYIFILSFSQCLEWLRERGYTLMGLHSGLVHQENNARVEMFHYESEGDPMKPPRRILAGGKTHHEAIAKAVVGILEEKEDAKK